VVASSAIETPLTIITHSISYYPLYLRVREDWNAGRWPHWEREENAGMPILGNPTAAVLYPGMLVFAMMPYPWSARIYVLVHTASASSRSAWWSWPGPTFWVSASKGTRVGVTP